MLREPFHKAHLVANRPCRIVATLELLEHHFAKVGHSVGQRTDANSREARTVIFDP
jgi:hypothetical protein